MFFYFYFDLKKIDKNEIDISRKPIFSLNILLDSSILSSTTHSANTCSKLTIEARGEMVLKIIIVVLVSLMLILNIFRPLF